MYSASFFLEGSSQHLNPIPTIITAEQLNDHVKWARPTNREAGCVLSARDALSLSLSVTFFLLLLNETGSVADILSREDVEVEGTSELFNLGFWKKAFGEVEDEVGKLSWLLQNVAKIIGTFTSVLKLNFFDQLWSILFKFVDYTYILIEKGSDVGILLHLAHFSLPKP